MASQQTAAAAAQPPSQASSGGTLHRGVVKSVGNADRVTIRGVPRGGPPPEKTVYLCNIVVGKCASRGIPGTENSETKDEPYAWEAREFLRKKCIGKDVCFVVEYKVPNSGREYGWLYLGKDTSGENLVSSLVAEGLAEVRRQNVKAGDEQAQQLCILEDTAKSALKGKWGGDPASHVREVKWTLENPKNFVDSLHGKPLKAVIEHVRDGSTVRAFLQPNWQYVTVMLSGIRCPGFKQSEGGLKPEEFAEEAKFFTESRLLQRDVEIILEGVASPPSSANDAMPSMNQNLLGTVLHPNGNISELLVKNGFARCIDWSMGVVTQGPEKLRAAEKIAKEAKLRLWKDYTSSSSSTMNLSQKSFQAKVVEIVNGDALVVQMADKTRKKIHLASVRPPRPMQTDGDGEAPAPVVNKGNQRSRPLYEIPFMFEAREFLRKKLIGKRVNVEIDYVQPPREGFPEKTCCTVTIGGINVAEVLVSKGLATVVRYRLDDDQRSSHYDVLLAAEQKAKKNSNGIFSKKDSWPIKRVADVSGDQAKAKQFLPFLQRAGRTDALVEFVASGSRLRLYLPKETCLITFLLAGIDCPRSSRAPGVPDDPYCEEAAAYTRDQCLQHEVQVEVEAMDRVGNFIGWLFVEGVNVSVSLVEAGLSKVHFSAERSNYYSQLVNAEKQAKLKKLNIWEKFVEEEKKPEEIDEGPRERKLNYVKIVVTEVDVTNLNFYAQHVEKGPSLEALMQQMRDEFTKNPPLEGAYTPRRGDICAARFIDNEWYRAKVEKIQGPNITVLYIDYGNSEVTSAVKLAQLPAAYQSLPPQAHLYGLACVTVPNDPEMVAEAVEAFKEDSANVQLLANVEYKTGGVTYVTLSYPDAPDTDLGKNLLLDGLLLAETRKERRLNKLVSDYRQAMNTAKRERKRLWQYGDFTDDDAKEFGMGIK